MKFSLSIFTLALCANVLARIEVEKDDNGATLKVINIPDRLEKRTGSTTSCFRDNCFRAMTSRISAASTFCPTFTTATVTATTSLGPWQSQCDSKPSRVSSACSCLVPPPPAPTCGIAGSPCTVDNFVQVCCDIVGCGSGCKGCSFPGGDTSNGYCL